MADRAACSPRAATAGRRRSRSSTACGSRARARASGSRSRRPTRRASTCAPGAAAAAGADPLLEPATLAAARALRERYLGALLGLAVGDARRRGHPVPPPRALHARRATCSAAARSTCRAGPGAMTRRWRCAWPRACSSSGGFDARDQVARYRRWQQEGYLSATDQCVGITAGTARALARAQWRRQSFSGSHDPDALDPEPLSRVPAVVLYYFADRDAALGAVRGGRAHHLPGTAGAGGLPGPGRGAARGRSRAQPSRRSSPPPRPLVGHTAARRRSARRARRRPRSRPRCDCFARTDNFRDAVLAAANLGGAADVVAGVAGRPGRGPLHCRRHPRHVAQQPDEAAVARGLRRPAAHPRPGAARQLRRRAAPPAAVQARSRQPAPGCRKLAARSFPLVSFPTRADVHDSRPSAALYPAHAGARACARRARGRACPTRSCSRCASVI